MKKIVLLVVLAGCSEPSVENPTPDTACSDCRACVSAANNECVAAGEAGFGARGDECPDTCERCTDRLGDGTPRDALVRECAHDFCRADCQDPALSLACRVCPDEEADASFCRDFVCADSGLCESHCYSTADRSDIRPEALAGGEALLAAQETCIAEVRSCWTAAVRDRCASDSVGSCSDDCQNLSPDLCPYAP
jgi:hypothetical protein